MTTLTDRSYTKPAHVRHHPQRQLARYLMRHAGPLPPSVPMSQGQRVGSEISHRASDRSITHGDRDFARALATMRAAWSEARGYFPGRSMPVPRFGGQETTGAVGWSGDTPVGITWDRGTAKALRSHDSSLRDEALRTLLHEWAHNFQSPSIYQRERGRKRPTIEGGAEAFAFATAPRVAAAMGRPYLRRNAPRSMRFSEYRPFVARVLRRGMPWVMEGQFQ